MCVSAHSVLSPDGVGVSREEEEGEDEGRMGARCGGLASSGSFSVTLLIIILQSRRISI